MHKIDHKKLVVTFERMAQRQRELGFDKEDAERMGMRMALRLFGWTAQEADQMTENIFASQPRKDGPR